MTAPEPDLATLLLQGQDAIARTAQAHAEHWGLGSADAWELDQREGLLRWTFPDRQAEAPAQVLGTFSRAAGTWRWGWANDSLAPSLRTAGERVRAWGEAHGEAVLTTASLEVDEEQAGELAAIAFRLSGCGGYYRAPTATADVHLAFGEVRTTTADGQVQVFRVDLGA